MSEKSTGNSKKYNVSICNTSGTVISAIGPNAHIEITNRTMIGNVEHFYCGSCSRYVAISQYLMHQSAH